VRVGRPNRGYKSSCGYPPANLLTIPAQTPPLRQLTLHFVLVEVLLPKPKPAAEKETFWAKFRAGFEARLGSMKTDIALHFVEMRAKTSTSTERRHRFEN
jgi:hypothetical protein